MITLNIFEFLFTIVQEWYKDFVLDLCINSTKDYDITVELLKILDTDEIEKILTHKVK